MSEEEIVQTFRLSLITESLTEQYTETYMIGAKRYDAPWLANYIVSFWEPDEFGHAEPFKNILMDFGLSKKCIENEIREARESTRYHEYHSAGFHPINLTTYGVIQESITDYWYQLQQGFFSRGSSAAKAIAKVKGREALHTVQFRALTALQLEADPSLITEIIKSVSKFQMPGNHIPPVKYIAAKTREWIPRMNGSVGQLLKRIVREVHWALDDKHKLGFLVTNYASQSERRFISLLPNSLFHYGLSAIHGGHGLVGEMVIEQLGLGVTEQNASTNVVTKIHTKFRNIIKRWIQEKLDFEGLYHESAIH